MGTSNEQPFSGRQSNQAGWLVTAVLIVVLTASATRLTAAVGVGARAPEGATVLIDGSRRTLDQQWTYWEGPRFASSLPIKWKIVEDPVDAGECLMSFDPVAAGGKYGTADIVTREAYRDFRLHVEFLVMKRGGNSGVYLQNRYEIQVLDGDRSSHGMGAVINETPAPYHAYNGTGAWNAYDIVFRAARFRNGVLTEKARVSMYFNGLAVHDHVEINKVWGGPNSGVDGGNDGGQGITDTPQGLKLQCEGHDVRYRNTWIKPLELQANETRFREMPVSLTRIPESEKAQLLFDSRSLQGWEGDQTRWSVSQGMIWGRNDDGVPSSTYLLTKSSHREFRLILDVRQTIGEEYSTMHSAVCALGEKITDKGGNPYGFRGPLFMFCHDWGIWDAHRRNRVVDRGKGPQWERRGEWNRVEILVKANRLRFALNGKEVFDFEDDPRFLQASPIGLQLHANKRPQEYRFRHIVLSETPSAELLTIGTRR